MQNKELHADFLIVGSGLAGLFAAHHASKFGKVIVLTKTNHEESNSWMAQGGIAAALADNDSTNLHMNDTLIAGRELCDEEAVRVLVEEGKDRILELIEMGMEFDNDGRNLSFGMEGGHSVRRILHANGSATGEAVLKFLIKKTLNNPNINFLFNTQCIDFVRNENRIIGAYAFEYLNDTIFTIHSKSTIVATGGYSSIYQRSTNAYSSIGEGISMAMKVGAEIRDMEFIQFHPTAFFSTTGETFLISEAVRGEGAFLLNEKLDRFMLGKHELKELAPRDTISKAIHYEIQNSNLDYVYLDLRHLDSEKIKNNFTNIYNYAKKFSTDITKDLIPIAPAAHYSIGGIKTDLSGKTNLEGLFACGEVSATGVHGANRLASNSLLECLVFSKRAVHEAAKTNADYSKVKIEPKIFTMDTSSLNYYHKVKQRLQKIFFAKVGIIRDGKKLLEVQNEIAAIRNSILTSNEDISIIKLNGILDISEAIVKSALARKESRGTHQRSDFPNQLEEFLGNYSQDKSELKFEESKWILEKTI